MIEELVCSVVALALYVNTLGADFCYDDSRAIKTNQDLLPETPWINIFYDDFWGTLLTHSGSHKSYRPLCTLSFRLNRAAGGLDPWGYHLVNVGLHAAVTALFVWFSRGLLGAGRWALAAGLLFAAHPVHTEAVAGVVGRADLGAGLFFLLSLLCYAQHCALRPDHTPFLGPTHCWAWLLACLLLAACSMLWKEQGLTVLGLAAAYDLFICHRLRLRALRQLLRKSQIPSLFLSLTSVVLWGAALLAVRLYWMGNKPPVFSNSDNPAASSPSLLTRTLTFLYLPAANFWLLLCPSTLSFDWSMDSMPLLMSLSDWRNLHSVTFYTGLVLLALLSLQRLAFSHQADGNSRNTYSTAPHNHISNDNTCTTNGNTHLSDNCSAYTVDVNSSTRVCCCCHESGGSLTGSPCWPSEASAAGGTPRPTIEGVVLFSLALLGLPYLPATNLFFYVGFVMAERVLYIPSLGFCLLVALGLQRLSLQLRRRATHCAVLCCYSALLLLFGGKTLLRNQDWSSEETLFKSGIAVNPAKAWGNFGNVLKTQGKMAEAERAYWNALYYRSSMADVLYNLGLLMQEREQLPEALRLYKLAIASRPSLASAYLNTGIILMNRGQLEEAKRTFRTCADIPDHNLKDPHAHCNSVTYCLYNLGKLLHQEGQQEEAIAVFKEAVQKMPLLFSPQSLYNLMGEAYARLNRLEEAELWYQKSLRAKANHVPAHLTYAKLLAITGRKMEAEQYFLKAIDLDPSGTDCYMHYGHFLIEESRFVEAAEMAERAVKRGIGQFDVVFSSAHMLRRAGFNTAAEKYYGLAASLRPGTFSPLPSESALPRSVYHNYTARDVSAEACECLNGGWCREGGECDCSQFQALGDRCQIIPNMGQDRDGICRSWGQHHFETFDGIYYYFPGTCSYILAKDCRSTEPQYTVWVHNSRSCRGSVYSCSRYLSLHFPNEEEITITGYQVKQGGVRISLPQTVHNVFLERLADYILVKSTFGFSLAWDGSSGVYVRMTEEHKGKACGLCGNYNDDGSDDLTTNYNVQTEDVAQFGNSWVVQLPQERRCRAVEEEFPGPCPSESRMDDAIEKCSALLFFPFLSCHENIDPNPFVAGCVSDLCVADDVDTFCRTLVEYTRACSHVGYPVREWRDSFPQCSDGCEDSFVHRDCISCCPPTCTFEKECLGSNLHCLDGCYCPDAECSVTGDSHVSTFDGRMFLHSGACQYVLAKSRGSGRFTLTLQYVPCGESQEYACMHSVTLVMDEDVSHQVTLSREGEVLIGINQAASLPYKDDTVEVRRLTTAFTSLKTAFGLRLQLDRGGGRLYLQLDSSWRGQTLGLCGTFNGNLRDDFLSPSGMIEGTPQLHANAWKVSSACTTPVNVPIIDPCEMNQQNVFYASMCDVISEELFRPCHAYVSPAVYHQQCRFQACRCGRPCLCAALAHYARICAKHRAPVNFRAQVSECGMVCLGGMMYSSCTSSCGRTCQSLSSGEDCPEEDEDEDDCAEGCSCADGSYYDEVRQRCVQASQCHCYFMGSVFQPGEVSFSSSGPCLCRNGQMECVPEESEPEHGECPPGKVYYSCRDPQGARPRLGIACEVTCRNLMMNLTCPPMTPCVPGCGCPEGLVRHDGECYFPENCPCAWLGLDYLPGETVATPCYSWYSMGMTHIESELFGRILVSPEPPSVSTPPSVCHRGFFNCTHYPCPAVCTVYSDRHYHTFDGLEYDYVSDCQVYLVKSINDTEISITAQNKDCYESGIVCMKYLVIYVGLTKIYFSDNSGKPSVSTVIGKGFEFQLLTVGYYTVVHFPKQEITILWDRKTTVHVRAGPQWKGRLTGMCGNFDTVTANDMTTSGHLEVSNPQAFGDSWALGQCESDFVVKRPCEGDLARQPYAKRECALLYSDVFASCHNVVDVTWFYKNCLTDTCNCNRGGDCECLCTSVGAYAHKCCQHRRHHPVEKPYRLP
ncbi:hypothetical protein GJAV_G00270270 [Gymnothorax javanicus]|nr:hypothetical protein GJAV_G00270270 [Gymnothorax javanicus]